MATYEMIAGSVQRLSAEDVHKLIASHFKELGFVNPGYKVKQADFDWRGFSNGAGLNITLDYERE